MSYDFSFDKKSVFLILAGCVAIGVLLFFAGYIVGLDREQNQSSVQASIAPKKGQTAKSEPQAEPVVMENPSTTDKQEPPAVAVPKKASAKNPTEVPANTVESKSTAGPSNENLPAATAPGKDEEAKSPDKSGFSLQLGAFQTEANALRLKDNLKAKGYPVFLFRALDANGNLWHTVRLGHYANMKDATKAATKMTGKEQIATWVRPSNAF